MTLTDSVRLLPTPTASDAKNCTHRSQAGGPSLSDHCRLRQTPQTSNTSMAAVVFLPTPRATDGTKGCPAQRGSKGDLMLPSAIIRLLSRSTPDDTV
ncbi:hypothetical protein [Lentzea guizhouensis]|uniref:hypothetical protein n=1 Tax=Lentzea guizhouensis TaxID=1586287 RepID=UPI0012B68158|nr:hypothetical protein [Lentzea guizhouensis]